MITYKELAIKVEALSLRERVLLMLSVLALIYFVWDAVIFNHFFGSKKKMQKNMQSIESQISRLQSQISDISSSLLINPIKDLKKHISDLKNQNEILEKKIKVLTQQLIPPTEMTEVLTNILSKSKDLTVINISNLPETPIFTAEEVGQENLDRLQVYKHGLQMDFNGGYFATRKFLSELEKLKWKLLWDELHYSVSEYPNADIRLVVNTLSLQQQWIGS